MSTSIEISYSKSMKVVHDVKIMRYFFLFFVDLANVYGNILGYIFEIYKEYLFFCKYVVDEQYYSLYTTVVSWLLVKNNYKKRN